MTGKPGRSGGKRTGAGRPVETVRLKLGDKWLIHERTAEGVTLGTLGTVALLTRNRIEIVCDDGVTVVMFK